MKVLKLPKRDRNATAAANELLKNKVEEIFSDFVTEVEICCEIIHPNLVRLLGYATGYAARVTPKRCPS